MELQPSQRRPGRPRKLTPRQECLLMRRVEENRHASSLQLSKEVESQTGVTISCDTIRRTLQRNGMHGCRPRKKPLLKPRHKKARLEFARTHADKDEDYWDSILWSDETKIYIYIYIHSFTNRKLWDRVRYRDSVVFERNVREGKAWGWWAVMHEDTWNILIL